MKVYKSSSALKSQESFRSPQSDIEIPKTRKRKGEEGEDKGESTATLTLDPLAMTKENMSTSRRPAGKKTEALLVLHLVGPFYRFCFHSTKTIRLATNFDTL